MLRWERKTEQANRLGQPLRAIAKVLDQASDDQLIIQLRPHLNIDRFLAFWALEIILDHNDGYSHGQKTSMSTSIPATMTALLLYLGDLIILMIKRERHRLKSTSRH